MKKMGFGMMRLPLTDKNDLKSVDLKQINEMVDKYMQAGFNYFDTAYPYHDGASEVAIYEFFMDKYMEIKKTEI